MNTTPIDKKHALKSFPQFLFVPLDENAVRRAL
jgi:hypothetical protein